MMNRDVMGREVMGRAAVCAPTPHEAGGVSLTAAAVDFAHEADGMTLHLSAKSATGYKGVIHCPSMKARPFKAMGPGRDGAFLGYFATAVEAAVCYARHHVQSAARQAAAADAHASHAAHPPAARRARRSLRRPSASAKHLGAPRQ